MADEQGVIPTPPPGEDMSSKDVTPAAPSPAEGVTAASPPADRPWENVLREYQRRDQERQKQLETVLAWIGAQANTPRATVPQSSQEVSDDDLWALAQQGNREAFETYQRRIAEKVYRQQSGQQGRQHLVVAQVQTLVNRYPVLRDPSHPLTQTYQQAYALLVQNGYPANQETVLEALKTAIADRPDLIAELHNQAPQAREQTRQSATTRAQAGTTGTTVRQSTPAPSPTERISPEAAKLAARMGIKDPKGARERFLKRQESGQSQLGAVGGFPAVIHEMENF